jgi:hypothetical protein
MTSPEKEVLKTKVCCACRKEKDITSFYRNIMMPTGWEARCKLCKKDKVSCRAKTDRSKSGRPKQMSSPQLWNVKKEDWIETYDFLKTIGYDLSGDKTIHEQFCEKYNLKPRKRMYEKSIQYSPKDLGLV